ncbi:MAG: DUF1549 domain-containing protein [Verrucomicrobia bacterium]|nr:DUF1549 domain-containing protein [Verrucomicrobiota bacterium]
MRLGLSFILFTSAAIQAGAEISFNRDVRPILSENCFACHGFDPKHREGNLRLDQFEGATADRDGSRGITPGDLNKSDIWQRIISTDKDELMPPPKSHKPALTAKQRDIIKTWIEQGAKYERHWSFEPPKRAANGSIDHFIQQRLQEEKLKPSPEADAATLIRRVSLDLTGLPPAPADLSDLSDWSDQKYQALVDRLLKSQHQSRGRH